MRALGNIVVVGVGDWIFLLLREGEGGGVCMF